MARTKNAQPILLNPPPLGDLRHPLWADRMRLLVREQSLIAQFFAAKTTVQAEKILGELDKVVAAIALNAEAQHLPTYIPPRPRRDDLVTPERPVFGRKERAA